MKSGNDNWVSGNEDSSYL